jgi:5-formyltetrahydrofolate cyclo-ligase
MTEPAPPSDPAPQAPKTALRARAALARARAHSANPMAGATLSAVFPRALLPRPDAVVAGYWPFRTEIDPRPLMGRLARLGARLALPVTPAKGSDAPLSFRLWTPGGALAPGAFRVHEPGEDCETVAPDLLLVPLLAFDRSGRRLGYGAGHYDRTLAGLRAARPTPAIGLAFAAQEVERVPTDPHDQHLDGVVTERAYTAFEKDL